MAERVADDRLARVEVRFYVQIPLSPSSRDEDAAVSGAGVPTSWAAEGIKNVSANATLLSDERLIELRHFRDARSPCMLQPLKASGLESKGGSCGAG
jgi:hypothetical protein